MHPHRPKPWRKKPAGYLQYWSGRPERRSQVKSIRVFCVGGLGERCGHNAELRIADLPDWTWAEISAHLRCTECGAVGFVDVRPVWPKVPMGTAGLGQA